MVWVGRTAYIHQERCSHELNGLLPLPEGGSKA
jgi:hypothetical protein